MSAGAADDDSLVESLRCHACGCYWRQHADATDRQCPSCGGDFVERMGVAVAAARPRIAISEATLQQMVASQMAAGQQAGITVQELMLNMAQFGAMEADGAGRSMAEENDPELREALERSIRESQAEPKMAPPASVKASGSLKRHLFDATSAKDKTCVVCSEDYGKGEGLLEMPCGHRFHAACLRRWLKATNSCPVCRYELETDDEAYERARKDSQTKLSSSSSPSLFLPAHPSPSPSPSSPARINRSSSSPSTHAPSASAASLPAIAARPAVEQEEIGRAHV